MLQLINLSNYNETNKMFAQSPEHLTTFLKKHHLDGIEMMFCDTWNKNLHKIDIIKGTHLWFWNDWLDFWHGYFDILVEQYGSLEDVRQYYGTLDKNEWLQILADNLKTCKQTQPQYMVCHIANARLNEIYNRKFHYSAKEVIKSSCELINTLTKDLPAETELLFENLWWPGLTLLDKDDLAILFENVKHPNCGLMLDTGHLANTNLDLRSQEQAVEYIISTIDKLGEYKKFIKGIHLHCSLTGEYVRQSMGKYKPSLYDAFIHVNKIDRHLPFHTVRVKEIIEFIKPKYLVHEFIVNSIADLEDKISIQQEALGL